jgi:membrane peptidoglycan carboxypeptidase
VIVLADGTEIASIGENGLSNPREGYRPLVDYVLRELTTNSDYWPRGMDGAEALGLNSSQETGLTVALTVDPAVHEVVESVVRAWHDDPRTFIGVVVVDNDTGGVLAAGPGSPLADAPFDPGRRLSAASLAQVYTTVAALEAGFPLGSTWDASSPQTFTSQDWPGEWTVYNAGGSASRGPAFGPTITLESALYRAVDTVFAAIGIEVGPEAVIDAARRLGADLTDTEEADPPPSVAIGAGILDTFDAAAIFATLSREGVRTKPYLIESITDSSGRVVYEAPRAEESTVDPDVVAEVRRPLRDVTTRGTAAGAFSGFDQSLEPIGKTGTAQEFTNAWYVGSTDRYTVAVAVGRTDGGPLMDLVFKGQLYARVFGGSVPAPVWVDIVSELAGTE